LMRFGLKDVNELPSMEEFEKLVAESFQSDLLPASEDAASAGLDAIAPPEQSSAESDGVKANNDRASAGLATNEEDETVETHAGRPQE
jgi:segregation and condensation protein B